MAPHTKFCPEQIIPLRSERSVVIPSVEPQHSSTERLAQPEELALLSRDAIDFCLERTPLYSFRNSTTGGLNKPVLVQSNPAILLLGRTSLHGPQHSNDGGHLKPDLVQSNLDFQLPGRTPLYGPQHSNNGGLIKPVSVQSNLLVRSLGRTS